MVYNIIVEWFRLPDKPFMGLRYIHSVYNFINLLYLGTLSVRVVTFEKLMAKISDFYSSFTNEWATF